MKIGDKIVMFFHCAGLVSKEECEITNFDNETVELDDQWIFNKSDGTCINDNTFMGAKRTIESIK